MLCGKKGGEIMLRKLLDKIAKKVAEKYDQESIFYWVAPKEKSGWVVYDIGWGEYACKCCGYITSGCNKPCQITARTVAEK